MLVLWLTLRMESLKISNLSLPSFPSLSLFSPGPPPLISTGGIIGIVLALIVIAFFIVPFLCGYGRECWKKGQLRGWWSRQRHRVRTWTQNIRLPTVRRDPRPVRRNLLRPRSSSVPLITETDNILTSSASTTSTDDNTTNTTQVSRIVFGDSLCSGFINFHGKKCDGLKIRCVTFLWRQVPTEF